MTNIAGVVFLLAASLAADEAVLPPLPLGFSLLPPKIEWEPSAKPVKCEEGMTTFDPDPTPFNADIPVASDVDGKRVEWKLRPGILLSECGFVHTTNLAIEHRRLKIEVDSLKSLFGSHEASWARAERGYQDTIVTMMSDLRDANAPSFWEEYDAEIMFGLGLVLGVAACIGIAELVKLAQPPIVVTTGQ